ncbi:aldo/keto reductase [Mammaliicoccus sciuri]|uniref:aldo/keto reductase n=1 Tax=Mammaliicoccus sciuri TaxID=1296 RepID=UPI0021CF0FED|nr:aldo/keto reductase [Mammaliicoccus sciuri]UXU82603.1 aldo/keto reductase [Mammaliicoccus sciuri]UXU92450.1 aldo/keto reductase [Mammaliicoccus sciuri]UXV14349.1 aldo/keto reductase [Mammaliicoccus sciuri]UXV22665.1 aldo/keto reductase [Mammaliicoccus sciuri]UXV25393.1 aldo/keto reductase [Mammaliicoccus sciuri]
MQKNTLKSGIEISEVGLGCMSLGTDINHAETIVDEAIKQGITYFDTADLYDCGENEKIVGQLLKKYQNQQDIVVGSKVGNHFDKDKQEHYWDPSKEHIMKSIKESLQRLNLEQLDIYMLHGGTIEDNKDETIEAFERLKEQGLIKAYGISSIRPNVIGYYLKNSNIETIMMQFSILDNRPESLLEKINEHGVKILARGPVSKGLLTHKSNEVLDRKFKDGLLEYNYNDLSDTISQLNKEYDDLSSVTFSYLKSFDALGSIITGASSPEQLAESIHSYNETLSEDQLKHARSIVKNIEYTNHLV